MRRILWALFAVAGAMFVSGTFWIMHMRHEEMDKQISPAVEPREKKVLPALLAGQWYTADKAELAAEIDSYLDQADPPALESVHALILPHAGYRYSGATAAYGVKSVAGKHFKRVIILGPTHRLPMRNAASVPDVTHYATPLGEVPLDVEFLEALRAFPQFISNPVAHEGEHSVQIEVPLLQQELGEFHLVPIVVGQIDLVTARAMARALGSLIDEDTLVVVSSDFTHYGANFDFVPFRDAVFENLEKLDMGAAKYIENRDAEGFLGYVEETGATICGRYPIAVLLSMLPSNSKAHLLHYDTSGRMTGDSANSVSYLAMAFTGQWPKGEPMEAQHEASLSEQDKAQLLKLARGTLTYYLEHRTAPTPEEVGVEITPAMKAVMGAFVTLHENEQLRGCIGEIFPQRPLYEAVMAHAVNAGVNDHRFPRVSREEVPALHFEISALTPPKPVDSYEDIIIGTHGMFIEKHGCRAVFLPQVAPEQGWDLAQTLDHLCLKAGLPQNGWREGAKFTVFEAIVFSEEKK